jgi:hypothetical protein
MDSTFHTIELSLVWLNLLMSVFSFNNRYLPRLEYFSFFLNLFIVSFPTYLILMLSILSVSSVVSLGFNMCGYLYCFESGMRFLSEEHVNCWLRTAIVALILSHPNVS